MGLWAHYGCDNGLLLSHNYISTTLLTLTAVIGIISYLYVQVRCSIHWIVNIRIVTGCLSGSPNSALYVLSDQLPTPVQCCDTQQQLWTQGRRPASLSSVFLDWGDHATDYQHMFDPISKRSSYSCHGSSLVRGSRCVLWKHQSGRMLPHPDG